VISSVVGPVQAQAPAGFNWRQFWILFGAAILGVVALQPYALHVFSATAVSLHKPLWAVALSGALNIIVLATLGIVIGMRLGKRIGLGVPILEACLAGESVGAQIREVLLIAVPTGAIAASFVPLIDKYYFVPRIPALAQPGLVTPAWMGFLASFCGGIDEELMLRFGFLTLLAWLIVKVTRIPVGRTTAAVFWAANILAALAFGAGHLPATRALVPLTSIVVLRALSLNGYMGIILGYLYWKRGLECAMVAHFCADIVVHVLLGT